MDEVIVRITGAHMVLVSVLGLCVNIFMLFHYLHLPTSGFNLLCSSKILSNCMSLLIYLLYVGPVNVLYTNFGSCALNDYLNQALGFGLLLQGPIIQCMIAVNRLVVVWCSPLYQPASSTQITVAAIFLSWTFTAWFSTLLGLPDDCRGAFNFAHVPCQVSTKCNVQITWFLVYSLFGLAGTTNFMNILIALKLFCMSRSGKVLSSESSRSRRRLSIRFFLQSCFQDWIMVLDFVNNFSSTIYCSTAVCITSVTMGFDVLVYFVDGAVMYLFNRKVKAKEMVTRVKSVDFVRPKTTT